MPVWQLYFEFCLSVLFCILYFLDIETIFSVAFAEIVGTKDKVFYNFTCENNDNHQDHLLKCSYGDNDSLEWWIFYLRCWTVVRTFSWYVLMTIDANDDNNDDDDDDDNREYNEYSTQGV